MYMLPNLPFLTLFFYSIPLPFGPHSEDGISQNSAPLEAKRVFIWTRGVRNLITPSEVACPEFDICMCSMYDAQRPTSTACKITSSLSDGHGSRQKPKRQFFFSRNSTDDAAWQAIPIIISFLPHFRAVDDDRRGPKWAHSDLDSPTNNPQTALSTPWIFFPARSPFGAYQRLCTAIQGCRQCSHPRATIATDQFFAPARQVPFTPSPVGSAPPSMADSFNSDNYDQ